MSVDIYSFPPYHSSGLSLLFRHALLAKGCTDVFVCHYCLGRGMQCLRRVLREDDGSRRDHENVRWPAVSRQRPPCQYVSSTCAKQTHHQPRSASLATKVSTFLRLPLYYALPRYLCYGKHHNVFSHLCILSLPSLSHSFPRDLNMNSSISLPSQPMNLFKSLLCSASCPRYSRGRACEVGQFIRRPPLFSLIFSLLLLPQPSSPSSPLPHTSRYGRGDQINILTKVQHPQWSCQCGEKRTHSTYLSSEYIIRRWPARLHFDYFSLPAGEVWRAAGKQVGGRGGANQRINSEFSFSSHTCNYPDIPIS